MLAELREVTRQWADLGIALGLPSSKIDEIEANNPNDVKKCLRKVIDAWLKSKTNLTWQILCEALRSDLVDCNSIAQQIEEKVSSTTL